MWVEPESSTPLVECVVQVLTAPKDDEVVDVVGVEAIQEKFFEMNAPGAAIAVSNHRTVLVVAPVGAKTPTKFVQHEVAVATGSAAKAPSLLE
jgi:hypothetical protein